MRLTINLSGFLEEIPEVEAIPYLLKMYLREVLALDIDIDLENPYDTAFKSNGVELNYRYHLTDDDFYFILEK